MSQYLATVHWQRDTGVAFTDQRYSRRHQWLFDGGANITASSSPDIVAVPMSDAAAVDPEEAFVASIASCHMLWFLSIAAKNGFVVDAYRDEAKGVMTRDAEGRFSITEVFLHPVVRFQAEAPDPIRHSQWHEAAHRECFIANSVKSLVHCKPEIQR